jgi:hypothetical protein
MALEPAHSKLQGHCDTLGAYESAWSPLPESRASRNRAMALSSHFEVRLT